MTPVELAYDERPALHGSFAPSPDAPHQGDSSQPRVEFELPTFFQSPKVCAADHSARRVEAAPQTPPVLEEAAAAPERQLRPPSLSRQRATALVALCVTSLAAWLGRRRAALGAGMVALLLAYTDGAVNGLGVAALGAYAAVCLLMRSCAERGRRGLLLAWAQWLGAAALLVEVVPGFRGGIWDEPLIIKPDAVGFVPGYNVDLVLAASMALGLGTAPWARRAGRLTWAALRRAAWPTCWVIAVLLPIAFLAGHIRFEPMVHPLLPLFVVHNLLLVAVPEEVLFRGMLPEVLQRSLPAAWATPALVSTLAALVFGLGHLGGGPAYAFLSFLAGLGYAAAAQRAGGLAGSILAHTTVNVVHFVAFTYPALR